MKNGYYPYPRRDPIKNYFPLPNEIFSLDLTPGEIAVYGYLMRCEDRVTHQCHPSYATIGKAVKLSKNTVGKCVKSLCDKQLITTESTTVTLQNGEKHNGTLLYTLRPMEEALRYRVEAQRIKTEEEKKFRQTQRKLAALEGQCDLGSLILPAPDAAPEARP